MEPVLTDQVPEDHWIPSLLLEPPGTPPPVPVAVIVPLPVLET